MRIAYVRLLGCGRVDVVFAFDVSGNIKGGGGGAFSMQEFILGVARGLTLGRHCARVSVVTFGQSATVHFRLDAHAYYAALSAAVRAIETRGSAANLAAGIELVRGSAFAAGRGRRVGARHVCVLVSDVWTAGGGAAAAVAEARRARADGVEVLVVGVGPWVNARLLGAIAGDRSRLTLIDKLDATSTQLDALHRMLRSELGAEPGLLLPACIPT